MTLRSDQTSTDRPMPTIVFSGVFAVATEEDLNGETNDRRRFSRAPFR